MDRFGDREVGRGRVGAGEERGGERKSILLHNAPQSSSIPYLS